jgi:hypothetical protein
MRLFARSERLDGDSKLLHYDLNGVRCRRARIADQEAALSFSAHATRRMHRRRISEEEVRRVIREPDHTFERDAGCTEYVALLLEGFVDRRIEVVVDEARIRATL